MKSFISSVFRILCFCHEGNVISINSLAYHTSDLHSNINTTVSFVGDSQEGYASVGMGLFKDSYFMGTFPLPPPNTTFAPINTISSITYGSLGSSDTWVVPRHLKIESYGAEMSLSLVEITYLMI